VKFQLITFKKQFRLFSIGFRNVTIKTEKRHVVQARQLAMFLLKIHKSFFSKHRFPNRDRDHATVLHACKTVDNLVATDKQFKNLSKIFKKLTL
jgi:chromosomal replication initiator protein